MCAKKQLYKKMQRLMYNKNNSLTSRHTITLDELKCR